MRAKKGLRTIVIDSHTYYWKVSEDVDYFYIRELTVLNDQGKFFLKRRYKADTIDEHNPVITPSIVRSEILEEHELNKKRAILDQIEYTQAPQQWKRVRELYHSEVIAGIGLDIEADILIYARQLKINAYQRTILDLSSMTVLEETIITSIPENPQNNTFLPSASLPREVPCTRWNQTTERIKNQTGDHLCCYKFHPQFIYFQPAGKDCLQPEKNQGCVRLNTSQTYSKFGFSATGNYFVIAENRTLVIWKREDQLTKDKRT